MKAEIESAANFIAYILEVGALGQGKRLPKRDAKRLRRCLVDCLKIRYRDHWFVATPFKVHNSFIYKTKLRNSIWYVLQGSGYRCLRFNQRADPVFCQASDAVGLHTKTICTYFPSELTLWIDPLNVSKKYEGGN